MAKTKELKRVSGKEYFNYKKRLGDRTDGWRVHAADPTFDLVPHIMPMRCDSQVFFEEEVFTDALDNFVRDVRRDGEKEMPELSRLAVVMAACVRAFAKYPKTNRFCAGSKIYARNHYSISITIKQSMDIDSEETHLKMYFTPNMTLKDVYDVMLAEIAKVKDSSAATGTDDFLSKIHSVPQFVYRTLVGWVNFKDRHGGIPKWIYDISPFHTSTYITDIGSTGIGSVYHHIYNLGTTSSFLSIGKREKKLVLDDDGTVRNANIIRFCYVIDERVCDGFYYAKALRYINHLLKHPEELLTPPETIVEDPLC